MDAVIVAVGLKRTLQVTVSALRPFASSIPTGLPAASWPPLVAGTPGGRGATYHLTASGQELAQVCYALGAWGARWLETTPEHLDPYLAVWYLSRLFDRAKLPARRVAIRFDLTDGSPPPRYWLVLSREDTELYVRPTRLRRGPGGHHRHHLAGQMADRGGDPGHRPSLGAHPHGRPAVAGKRIRPLGRPQPVRARAPGHGRPVPLTTQGRMAQPPTASRAGPCNSLRTQRPLAAPISDENGQKAGGVGSAVGPGRPMADIAADLGGDAARIGANVDDIILERECLDQGS